MKNNQEDILKIVQNRASVHFNNSNVYYELRVRFIKLNHYCPLSERNDTENQ